MVRGGVRRCRGMMPLMHWNWFCALLCAFLWPPTVPVVGNPSLPYSIDESRILLMSCHDEFGILGRVV